MYRSDLIFKQVLAIYETPVSLEQGDFFVVQKSGTTAFKAVLSPFTKYSGTEFFFTQLASMGIIEEAYLLCKEQEFLSHLGQGCFRYKIKPEHTGKRIALFDSDKYPSIDDLCDRVL